MLELFDMPKGVPKSKPWVMPRTAPKLPLQAYKSKPSHALRTKGMAYSVFLGQAMGNNIADIGDWEDRSNSAVLRTLIHLGLRVYAKLIQRSVDGQLPVGPGIAPGARVWTSVKQVDREVLDQVVEEVVCGMKPKGVVVHGEDGGGGL